VIELDIASISAIIAAFGVIVGVVFTVLELRNLTKQRQTDLVIRLYSTMGSSNFQEVWEKTRDRQYESFKNYVTKYGLKEATQIGIFFEGIGVLLHRKLIDIDLVDDLFTAPVKIFWERMKPLVIDYRKERNRQTMFEWSEYLYNEMQKREQTLTQP
jgi:peroxiredoxin family protein